MAHYLSNVDEAYGPLLSSHWEKKENPQNSTRKSNDSNLRLEIDKRKL
jgi:hypothetical protein